MNKPEIFAVHRDKLEEFLRKLGLWEPLSKGMLKCTICEAVISIDNIGLIIPYGDEIILCCSNSVCLFKIKDLKSETTK